MCVAPRKPWAFYCPACRWRKAVFPRSDCFYLGRDWFESCPKCGNESLERKDASVLETLQFKLGIRPNG
ncbi:hypothetical protein EII20_12565 [Comamonadaceae bacterium OH2545_COT-014]|nr:hypothetical protein EII20_12565 [Comamonadaceae bacterium OH2545_COT-014]